MNMKRSFSFVSLVVVLLLCTIEDTSYISNLDKPNGPLTNCISCLSQLDYSHEAQLQLMRQTHLHTNINVFTEEDELLGSDLGNLLKRIEESEIALVIFSVDFTSSYWCLDQLAKIKQRKDQDGLKVIPIFYKVQLSVVQELRGQFGDNFRDLTRKYPHHQQRILKWEEALVTIPETIGMPLAKQSDTTDKDFITNLVIKIQILLEDMAKKRNQEREVIRQGGTIVSVRTLEKETEVPSSSNPAREPETEATHQGPSVVHLMLRAREMEISSSENPLKWVWSTIKEPPK